MTSENLFESFINQELGDKVDEFSGGIPDVKKSPASEIKVTVEYIHSLGIDDVISMMYETKYAPKINHLRPNGIYLINKIFQINMPLDDFASNYYSRLNDGVFSSLAIDYGSIMIGETLSEGIIYKTTYHNTSEKTGEGVNGMLEFATSLMDFLIHGTDK